jgi:hypothetical protein
MSIAIPGEDCPISEQLLFQIYDASKRHQPMPTLDVSAETRSMLALFCYRRSHLETAGLAIAATCEEPDLLVAGGALGAALFARSRNYHPPPTASRPSLKIAISTMPSVTTDEAEDSAVESEVEVVA